MASGVTQRYPLPPSIEPVPPGVVRPLWSVMIPVYHGADFLRESLHSVLQQCPDADRMQIEVVDNCSIDDDPEAVVRDVGKGRVAFFRQAQNVGAIENFNTCIRRASGHWVHILHVDDKILPDFYTRVESGITRHPDVGAVGTRIVIIDERGNWTGLSEIERPTPGVLDDDFAERLLIDQRMQFSGMVVRRSSYEQIGGFRPELAHTADWDMWKRIAVRHRIYYDPEPLACYRMHSRSLTTEKMRKGGNVIDERLSIEIARSYVRQDQDELRIRRSALCGIAIKAIRNAKSLWKMGERSGALYQVREAARCSLAPAVLARMAYLFTWILARSLAASRRRNLIGRFYSAANAVGVTGHRGRRPAG